MTTKSSWNALLVYPELTPSFMAMTYVLRFAGKKAGIPPTGLLTVAAMFPDHYDLKVVDMNVEELTDAHLEWADVVFTSTMIVQRGSLREVIERCNERGVPIVAGGPYPTSFHDEIPGVDHFVLDEVEESFGTFLEQFEAGTAPHVFRTPEKPDISSAPIPRFDLVNLQDYGSMAVQFSRGCPFTCEFCDIPTLFGRATRTKSNEQFLAELDALYDLGWRGPLFLADDNFIGNKRNAMRVLPALADWQRQHRYPFALYTEASVNMAEMEPLLDAMVEARFGLVFLGIESPNPKALEITRKGQNVKRGVDEYLLQAVRKIQGKGIEVNGGFIVGLDGDGPEVFDAQIDFIQAAGIPVASVSLLAALRGAPIYERLKREGRLLERSEGESVHLDLNFVPEVGNRELIDGYKRVISTLYEPTLKNYFERCWTMLENLDANHALGGGPAAPADGGQRRDASRSFGRLLRSAEGRSLLRLRARRVRRMATILGRSLRHQLFSAHGPAYVRFLVRAWRHKRHLFQRAMRLAMQGYHFEKITRQIVAEQVTELDGYGYAVRETPLQVIGQRGAGARKAS